MTGTRAIAASIAITIAVAHVLVMYSIRPYGYNLSALIRISRMDSEGTVPEYFQKGMVIFNDKGGYDGQYYYYAARDPFLQKGIYKNAFRQQRILYPLLATALAFGRERLLPYTLYLVNIASIALGMLFFTRILERYSFSPLWSLFYGLSPPLIMSLQYDLPSPLGMFLVLASVYYYIDRKIFWTAAFMSLAFLTREDSIMALIPMAIWDYQNTRSLRRSAVLVSSVTPFFAWQAYVTSRLGALPLSTSVEVLNFIPFTGIVWYLKSIRPSGVADMLRPMSAAVIFVYFMAVAFMVGSALRTRRDLFYYIVAGYCLLVPFTVMSQWDNYNGLLRMFFGFFPFLVLSYAVERRGGLLGAVCFIGALFVLTVIRILFISPVYPHTVW